MVYKCKMCGGTLNIKENETIAICEYCGTKQTVPKLTDEKKVALYDRANHFRRNNEFDKAMSIYEEILKEDPNDAESYWSIVLCRYGIEYVEDPKTHKRIPTVNRAQFTSVLSDEDYKQALKHADVSQSELYETEAKEIDEIQKGILAISEKEEPFDVFICYKETDNNGRRTQDSVYAQDIYKALTEEGYKVFFSRITLEDKLGTAYEPYIFAALNSAKVMLVVGTNKDYFNAVWVKNEWSRYLALVKSGKKKTIIPLYKDISPYDLPEEFSYIQSQDMSKIGFMQDLIHGISKLIPKKAKIENNTNIENQMAGSMQSKAMNFISMGDYKSAALCLDTLHAYDPNNAMYYIGRLLVEFQIKNIEDLKRIETSIVDTEYYINAYSNADEELKNTIELCGQYTVYNETKKIYENYDIIQYINNLKNLMDKVDEDFLKINDKDLLKASNELKEQIEKKYEERQEQNKLKKEKQQKTLKAIKKGIIIGAILLVILAIIITIITNLIIPSINYSKATKLYDSEDYTEALKLYSKADDFKDAMEKTYNLEQTLLRYAEVGDEVSYGKYYYTKRKEVLNWIVLERTGDEILLLTKDIIDVKPYHAFLETVKWTNSDLYEWLNNEFKEIAFNGLESSSLLENITILSENELLEYLPSPEQRRAKGTEYAKSRGLQIGKENYSCYWTRFNYPDSQNNPVLSTGVIDEDKINVSNTFVGVRVAIRVKVKMTSSELNQYTDEKNEEIYNQALNLYNEKKYNEALKKFDLIPGYKDAKNYSYEIRFNEIKSTYNEKDKEGYLKSLEYLKNANYEPAVKEYDKINKLVEEEKRKAAEKKAADEKEYNQAMKNIEGNWHWKNFFGYYMEIRSGVISYGTNKDHSVNHSDEVWHDNAGTIKYNIDTNTYEITGFLWATKLTYKNGKIRMYDEYGDPASFFDEYATKY